MEEFLMVDVLVIVFSAACIVLAGRSNSDGRSIQFVDSSTMTPDNP